MTFFQKKSLGQVFLKDKNIARKIADCIDNEKTGTVLEIGPGKGIVTEFLVRKFEHVYTVEIDEDLVDYLEKSYADIHNITIIEGDFIEFDVEKLARAEGKINVTGNVPYNLSSPILFKLFDDREYIHEAVLMLQKEVAMRIISTGKDKGITYILTRFYGTPEKLFHVKRTLFYPKPEIDSTVIKIKFYSGERFDNKFSDEFFRLMVKKAFGKRRKMLRNSLQDLGGFNFSKVEKEFNLNKRPEELSLEDFIKLGNIIINHGYKEN